MGNLLVLQALITGSSVSEMEFSHCPFWVQVHGLPLDRMTRRNGQIITSNIGSPIGVEGPHDGLLLYRSFLRIRVDIEVTKPHPIGFHLKRKDPITSDVSEKWVDYKYERLSDFCYDCGRIGHDNQSCKFVSPEARRHSGYGPNLRTGVASTLRLPPEYYHRLTDEMEANLRSLLRRTPASVTVAENPTSVGVEGTSGSQSDYRNSTKTDEVPRHPPLFRRSGPEQAVVYHPGVRGLDDLGKKLNSNSSRKATPQPRKNVSPTDEASPNLFPLIIPRIISPDSSGPQFGGPAYFVTEPTESPSTIPSPPSGFSQCLSPLYESSPARSPFLAQKIYPSVPMSPPPFSPMFSMGYHLNEKSSRGCPPGPVSIQTS
ncbi:uncharacterized protein LOC114299366 [Camellia sinensis]|uniref:uncharacterized protein LOC114299366 n=1 Tax=Camellia sinensis TaxID=4442 RepID=UPI0010357AD9|nr:uncharacterized protein LOC114299366 [Camellia sinensis]